MIINFMRRSIKNRYLVLLLIFGLLPIVISSLLSYSISSIILSNELSKSMYQTLEKASININSIIQRMSDLSDMLSRNSTISDIVSKNNMKELNGNSKEKRTINDTLSSFSLLFNFPTHIYIIDKNSNVFSNINFTHKEEVKILKKIASDKNYTISSIYESRTIILGLQENLLPGFDSDKVYYVAKKIFYAGEYYGTIYIGTGDYILSRMLNNININNESKILVYDQNYNIVLNIPETNTDYLPEKALIRDLILKREPSQYIYISGQKNNATVLSTPFDMNIIMLTPVRSISKKLNGLNIVTIVATLISIIFITIFLLLVNKGLVRPVIYLSNLMKAVRKGDLNVKSAMKNLDEIGILSEGFNNMLEDFKKMIEKIHKEEELKKELEFQVLQSQIKPHFLYNTLNSIRWIAEMNNESKVGDSIVSLARMLEYNTKGNNKLVKVKEEIQYIKEYIELQSLRYLNKIDIDFDIAEDISDYLMLKLSLQPIIENSIMHGLDTGKGKLMISIIGRRVEDKLTFWIIDKGKGIEEANLHNIKNRLESGDNNLISTNGLGLANVHKRIKFEFGENYGLEISSILGEGTTVQITTPII